MIEPRRFEYRRAGRRLGVHAVELYFDILHEILPSHFLTQAQSPDEEHAFT